MRCIKAQKRVLNSYVDMIEHSWNDGIITLEPTYEAEGEKTYTCTACESKRTEPVEKMETVVSMEMAEKLADASGKKSEILAMYDISLILNG